MRKLVERINSIREELKKSIPFSIDEEDALIIEDSKFEIYDDTLILYGEDMEEEQYHFVISSIGTLGKELFLHETETEIIVSAYNEEYGWDSANIYFLDKSKRIID